MKATGNPCKRGSALIFVFVIVLLVGVICSGMFRYSSQQLFTSTRTRDFIKAKVIAEAGANKAYNLIKNDFAAVQNDALFPETSFGEGTFDVTLTTIGTNKAMLVSVGKCGTAEARVAADLLYRERINVTMIEKDNPVDPSIFTNYPVLAGGIIEWRGGGELRGGGKVRANGKVDMNGGGEFKGSNVNVYSSWQIYVQGSSYIRGNAYAPSFGGKVDHITGSKVTTQLPFIQIPAIDLLPFYQRALAYNQVKSGTFSINSDYTPAGGVLWVNGDLKISNGRCNGCFVATGDIDISTSREMSSVNGYPLLISRDGGIKITSTPTMSGLVYARSGSIDWTGGGLLTGALIAAVDIDKGGGSDLVINFPAQLPEIPDTIGSSTNKADYVIITAWQE